MKDGESKRVTKPTALHAEGEEELRRKIADGSKDPEDYRNLADFFLATGRYEEAISVYQQALALPLRNFLKAKVSVELGWLFYEMGRQTEPLPLAQSAIELLSREPENAEVLACRGASQSLLAHCLWSTNEESGPKAARLALDWLERALLESSYFDGKAMAYVDAARLQNLLGNAKGAIKLCEGCFQEDMKDVERLSCLIVYEEALRREERLAEAEQVLQQAFCYVKGYKGILPGLYLRLGLSQRSANRLAEARETFRKALEALHGDPYLCGDSSVLSDINWNLAAVCYDLGEHKEAADAFQEVLRYHPDDDPYRCEALLWLGYSYQATGSSDKAGDCFQAVLASPHASETERTSARKGLGNLYYEAGKYAETAAAFEKVLAHQPKNDPSYWNMKLRLGYSYQAIDAYAKARDCYQEVLASPHTLETDKVSARRSLVWCLGNLYYKSGKYEEAAAAFKNVLTYYPADDPYHRAALLWMGYAYQAMRAYEHARDCFEKVVALPHASENEKASAREGLAKLPHPNKTLH